MSNKINSLSNNHSGKKAVNERAKQYKLYAIGSVVILGVIVLLVNILFDNLLGKALTFDFTLDKSSSISAESQKFIDSLPEGTRFRIVGLFERPESVVNTKYQYIAPLLDDYAKKSKGKIKTADIRPLMIKPVEAISPDLIEVMVYAGSVKNLRPDVLLSALVRYEGLSQDAAADCVVTRTGLFGGEYPDIEEIEGLV